MAALVCTGQTALVDELSPVIDGAVHAVALQVDGKILLGGDFLTINGVSRQHFARLNPDGSLDESFIADADGPVYALLVQEDGSIIVGGDFKYLSGRSSTLGSGLGRVNAAGASDASFRAYVRGGAVKVLAAQTDGKFLAGGAFSSAVDQLQSSYADRFLTDGSLELVFKYRPSEAVTSIALFQEGDLVMGGLGANLMLVASHGGYGTALPFNPESVLSLASLPDRKFWVAGNFTNKIARLGHDGLADSTFGGWVGDNTSNATVVSIAPQTDGKCLLGGCFTNFGGEACLSLAQVLPGGGLSRDFNVNVVGRVNGLAIQEDGRMIVAGAFTNIAGATRANIARIVNPAGASNSLTCTTTSILWKRSLGSPEIAQAKFSVSTNGILWSDLGAPVYAAGTWSLTNLSLSSNAMVRARGFVSGGEGNGSSWFVENASQRSLFINGQPISRTNNFGTCAGFDVTVDGTAPVSFQWSHAGTNLLDNVRISGTKTASLKLDSVTLADAGDYCVVVSNEFGSLTSATARLTVIDPFILTQPSNLVMEVFQSNTSLSVVAGGSQPLSFQWRFGNSPLRENSVSIPGATNSTLMLTNADPSTYGVYDVVVANSSGSVTSRTAVFTVNATPACSWTTNAGFGLTRAFCIQPDGKLVRGGAFGTSLSNPRNLDRCDENGVLDPSLNVSVSGSVRSCISALALQPDGAIIFGGTFSWCRGQPRINLARILPDGSLDMAFDPKVGTPGAPAQTSVNSLAILRDGKILIGGSFTKVAGQWRSGLARLNGDGSLDTNLNLALTPTNALISTFAVQPDGKVIIAGTFTAVAGQSQNGIARLNTDDTLDVSFQASASLVECMVVQRDGKIVLGGSFSTLNGVPRNYIGRINSDGSLDTNFNCPWAYKVHSLQLQSDGKLLIGNEFWWVWDVARINADSSIDWSCYTSGKVLPFISVSLALAPDGDIFVGESTSEWSAPFQKIEQVTPPTDQLGLSNSVVTWSRGGPGPEFCRVEFDLINPDGSYTRLGDGVAGPRGWSLTNSSVAADSRIHARGWVSCGYRGGSTWFIDSGCGPVSFPVRPSPRNIGAGSGVVIDAKVLGDYPLAYQWFKDGVPLQSIQYASNPTPVTLTLSNLLGPDSGAYTVVVSNQWGAVTSAVNRVTVMDPFVSVDPTNVFISFSTRLLAVPSGTTPLSYQWRKDGIPLSGAVSNSLQVIGGAETRGCYDVLVSNIYGTYTSAPARVHLYPVRDRQFPESSSVGGFAIQSDGKIHLGNQRLNFDGTQDASYPYTYQFYRPSPIAMQPDGKAVVGVPSSYSSPTPHLVRADDAGNLDPAFDVSVDGSVCSILIQPDSSILVAGSFAHLAKQACNRIGRLWPDGTSDTNFLADANSTVYTMALQPDGKIIVGGEFTTLCGIACTNVGRLNPDGSLDRTFKATIEKPVYCAVVQTDGKILLGGASMPLGAAQGVNRLNPDGTPDAAFWPPRMYQAQTIALQTDGKILIGGPYSAPDNYLRLNPDGSSDAQFKNWQSDGINGFGIQADGNIIVQARDKFFRLINSDPAWQTLESDGSTVTWLRGGSGPEIWAASFEYSLDGKEWLPLGQGQRTTGGWTLPNVSVSSAAQIRARGYLTGGSYNGCSWFVESVLGKPVIREVLTNQTVNAGATATLSLRVEGAPEATLQWFKDGAVLTNSESIRVVTNATLQIIGCLRKDAGLYYLVASNSYGCSTSSVAQLNVVDPYLAGPYDMICNQGSSNTIRLGAFGGILPLTWQWFHNKTPIDWGTNSSLILTNTQPQDAGTYYVVITNTCGAGTSRVANIYVNQATVDSWGGDLGTNSGDTYCLAQQADGKILAGGLYTSVCNQIQGSLARFNVDGSLDLRFNPMVDAAVSHLGIQPDGRILLAGGFTHIGNCTISNLARLNPDGALDTTFAPPVLPGPVHCILVQPDGRTLLGGAVGFWGVTSGWLMRLLPNGTIDSSFNASVDRSVIQMAVQADGKILVGGAFTNLDNQYRPFLGRLNPDGSLDTNFNPSLSSQVDNMALQPDGSLIVNYGSYFDRVYPNGRFDWSFNCTLDTKVQTIALQSDGSAVLGGGDFGWVSQWCLLGDCRICPDGSLDHTFLAGLNYSVCAAALQSDGKVVLGKYRQMARLNNPTPLTERLEHDQSRVTWLRGGSAPEIWAATFSVSTNGIDWSAPLSAQRVPGGWQLTNQFLPSDCFVLARGFVNVSGSSWVVETLSGLRATAPAILAQGPDFGAQSNRFTFRFTGSSHRQVVESSTNLTDWLPLYTNPASPSPIFFSTPVYQTQSNGFFRIHVLDP